MDFPWLSQMFSVPYALERVHQACPSDYIDPDSTSCEATATESLSPTTAPSSMSPPTVEPVACNLLAGDVAIVSFNSDTPDTLTVVALRSIPANSKLFFTDRPWNGNEFPTSSEGVLQFVTSDIVSAGSQWFYPDGGGVLGTWSIASGTFNLAADGDQIIVYCGAITSPTFLYALTNNGWISGGGSVSSTTSYFPDSLSGTNASVSLPSVDNQHYVGTTAGTESSLLETISISSNWTGSNTAASPTFISEFMVYELTFSPTASPSMISSSQRPTVISLVCIKTCDRMYFSYLSIIDVTNDYARDRNEDAVYDINCS